MEIPTRQEREWLTTFDVAAVYIACSSARCAVGTAQDLAQTLAARRRTLGRDAQFVRIWWIPSSTAALELAGAVALPPEATVRDAESAVRRAARRLRIPLAEHGATLARARAAIARLDCGLEVAKQRGVLSFFNGRYRFLREKAAAAGQPFQSYGTAHAQLKAELARRLAASGGGLPDLGGIVDTVLPPPTK